MKGTAQKTPVLTVTQLTQAIKSALESQFPSVWLQGEVSNCKLHSSGHLYFSLKDANAQISAIMFRGYASALKFNPKDGDQVVVYGQLNVYPPSGRYQINIQEMRLAGIGELLLKLEELKIKLKKLGWFNKEHKKPLPKFPQTIGVVTSPTGAAIQDILNILKRRCLGFHLILNPVKVQGEGAAEEIAKAIEEMNRYGLADVLIVGRGGGSMEDLWAFNEEIVASAIFHSKIPIVASVGHETDHCIAEYVADVRAPTPSAAAEIVSSEKVKQLEFLTQSKKRIYQTIRHLLLQNRRRLEGLLRHPVLRSPYTLLGQRMQQVDAIRQEIDQGILRMIKEKQRALDSKKQILNSLKPTTKILHFRNKLQTLSKQIEQSIDRKMRFSKERLKRVSDSLQAINPKNLLSRGYSLLFTPEDEALIKSVTQVHKDQKLKIMLHDGSILTTTNEVHYHDKKRNTN